MLVTPAILCINEIAFEGARTFSSNFVYALAILRSQSSLKIGTIRNLGVAAIGIGDIFVSERIFLVLPYSIAQHQPT